jgi:putative tricarboxylic transport membrane protein
MAALRRAAAPLGGLVAALVLLVHARDLDDIAREGQLGPGFWPRLVLGGLALACAGRAFTAWRGGPALDAGERESVRRGVLAAAVALIGLYVLAVPLIGFPLATAAFVAAFMGLAGVRTVRGLAATAAGGTIALLYVFVKLVYLPLPKGAGPFEDVTLALYRALRIF